jgi:hypothetical protein
LVLAELVDTTCKRQSLVTPPALETFMVLVVEMQKAAHQV